MHTVDPRNLNQALMRPHHPMCMVEEVVAQMSGATTFSVLDAKRSFSSLCTTFTTPYGKFKFLKMPFDISTASEVFQRAMEQIFARYPCAIIVDDIIVGRKGPEEHKANLREVMLDTNKCKFGLKEVNYVGHRFTDKCLKKIKVKCHLQKTKCSTTTMWKSL